MKSGNDKTSKILKILQIIFYLSFVFLWFKDNFLALRKIKISYAIPLIFLLLVLLIQLIIKIRSKRFSLRLKLKRDFAALALVILLASLIHAPFLVHNYGLMDGDEAIPALMGMHISESKTPAIYYYGALFQGSFPQHYYAFLFKIFGYSAFLAKLAAYLAFVAFLIIHFFLVQAIFSFAFACCVSLFYCLPLPHLVASSFDIGSGFPVVFFLGSLIFYLTYLIYEKNKVHLAASLGFLAGLAFWTHQISFIFILTSSLFLVLKFKFQWKKYLKIIFYFFVGAFPVLMSEVFWGFKLVRLLLSGEAGSISASKVNRAMDYMRSLLSSGPAFFNYLSLLLVLAGMAVLVYFTIKKKKNLSSSLFVVYFIAYMAVYLFSDFSNVRVIRYLYILYLVLPVFLVSIFLILKNRTLRYFSAGVFFLLLFFLANGRSSYSYYQTIKERHYESKRVLQAMEETGEKYWKGEYWIAYLLTSLAKEKLIVASSTVVRYPLYQLLYESEMTGNNLIFFRDSPEQEQKAFTLEQLLKRFKVSHKKKEIGLWLLLYDIQSDVFPKNLFFPPQEIPGVVLESANLSRAGLEVHFVNKNSALAGGFRVHVEIPGWCSRFFPLPQQERFVIKIPCPPQKNFKMRYYLDHLGFLIGTTLQEKAYSLPPTAAALQREEVEYLSGLGPRKKILGKNRLVCGREARFNVTKPLQSSSQISFQLYSPFFFDDLFWHGNYFQEVSVYVNDQYVLNKKLTDGENLIKLSCRFPPFKPNENIMTLKFKYALTLSIMDNWKTAALLEKVTVD